MYITMHYDHVLCKGMEIRCCSVLMCSVNCQSPAVMLANNLK